MIHAQNTAQSLSDQQAGCNVVGYVYDAAIYHPECFPDGVDRNNIDEVGAIFSWDASACTDSCDACLQFLLECDSDEGEESA